MTAMLGPLTFPARAATRESVVDAAKRESGLVWYDHYDRAASEGLLNAFQRVYPFVRQVEFVDVPSAQKIAKISEMGTSSREHKKHHEEREETNQEQKGAPPS